MIHWIEARHKGTGKMIKHSDFDRITCITSDNPDHLTVFFEYLVALRDMATGARRHTFLDYISRTLVETPEGNLLWYCKTEDGKKKVLSSHGKLAEVTEALIDEEEIYAADESLILSRNPQGAQMMEDQSFIPLNPSVSTVAALGHEDAQALYEAFSKIVVLTIPAQGPQALIDEFAKLDDQSIVLLNGIGHDQAWDIDRLIDQVSEDVQILAFGCQAQAHPARALVEGRKNISLAKA